VRPGPTPISPRARKINLAIDKGVVYLKPRLAALLRKPGGSAYRTGQVALTGLTLLECGVPAHDDVIQKAATVVRGAAEGLTNPYEMSVAIWFLDRLGKATDRSAIQGLALRLIARQTANGGWSYTGRSLSRVEQAKLLKRLQAAAVDGHKPSAQDVACLRYRPGEKLALQAEVVDDNSITQFVALALWVAREHGVPVERALALVEARFRASQDKDGSWDYQLMLLPPDPVYGRFDSMTCAGLMGLAVGRGARKRDGKRREAVRDPAIDKAVAFLGKTLGKAAPPSREETARRHEETARVRERLEGWLVLVKQVQLLVEKYMRTQRPFLKRFEEHKKLPRKEQAMRQKELRELLDRTATALDALHDAHTAVKEKIDAIHPSGNDFKGKVVRAQSWGDLYYLWSLERLAVVYDWKTIGGVDWYDWGSGLLLAAQHDDGSWSDAFPGLPDTCFALLFLKRANVAPSLTRELKADYPVSKDSK
jgi:hypothetical protein